MTSVDFPSDSDDPFSQLDQLCDFPCPVAAFSELRRYVRAVNEFLPHATAQQTVRLQARIKTEADPVAIGEFESELENIKLDEASILPRLVWGGMLVSIYAAFEFGIESVFHSHAITSHTKPFEKVPKKDFLYSAKVYAENQIGIHLFSDSKQHERLLELKDLRNSFVHRGAQESTLSPDLQEKIKNKVHIGLALELVDGQWVANPRSVAFYLLTAERVIKSFSIVAAEKYLLGVNHHHSSETVNQLTR